MSEKMRLDELARLARVAERNITGKRFCTSCQSMQPEMYGEIVGNKIKRWQCESCCNKRGMRQYKRKEKND